MLTGAAAVFTVADLPAARDHYRDVLGFAVTFAWGEPLSYVCLCRDEVQLHLAAAAVSGKPAGQGQLCIFVRDVDALHAELAAAGAHFAQPPQTYPYGMRECDIRDPDGNRIIFGMAVTQA